METNLENIDYQVKLSELAKEIQFLRQFTNTTDEED
jgi:hypothetical protein